MMNRKPIVVYREKYLPLSETFIYEQIKNLQEYQPYVLCKEKLKDSAHFPFKHVYLIQNLRNRALVLRRKGIRLIYARFGMGGVDMLPLKRNARLPMVTSFHGSDVSRQLNKRPEYREALPALFSEGEKFSVVCEYMKNKLIDLGCPSHKIHVIKSGIDLKKFPYKPKMSIPSDPIRILSVGRLTEKKGMDDLILGFSRVAVSYPQAKLIIVGEGEERNRLESMIWSLGLERNIELLGRLPHGQVQEEMLRCDLFVLASKTAADGNEEGIPNVIMEAMATGRTVISTPHAGIPELVVDRKTGYLTSEDSPRQLGSTILHAIKNQQEWPELNLNARGLIEEEHDVHKQIKKLENLLQKTILEHRRSTLRPSRIVGKNLRKRRG